MITGTREMREAAITRALMKAWDENEMIKILDNYKMDQKDFDLWLKYLATHPKKVDYINFKKFKEERGQAICQKK